MLFIVMDGDGAFEVVVDPKALRTLAIAEAINTYPPNQKITEYQILDSIILILF